MIIASVSIVDDTLGAVTTHPDQRGSAPEAVSSQRLAALLLVAALLPAVVASWSAGPIARVQTALVEASRLPGVIEAHASTETGRATDVTAESRLAPISVAPVSVRICTALKGRLDLCATPPPALA